jgi:hypothetical protein
VWVEQELDLLVDGRGRIRGQGRIRRGTGLRRQRQRASRHHRPARRLPTAGARHGGADERARTLRRARSERRRRQRRRAVPLRARARLPLPEQLVAPALSFHDLKRGEPLRDHPHHPERDRPARHLHDGQRVHDGQDDLADRHEGRRRRSYPCDGAKRGGHGRAADGRPVERLRRAGGDRARQRHGERRLLDDERRDGAQRISHRRRVGRGRHHPRASEHAVRRVPHVDAGRALRRFHQQLRREQRVFPGSGGHPLARRESHTARVPDVERGGPPGANNMRCPSAPLTGRPAT